jgi:methionine-rich copper-binding protein CopC
MRDHSRLSLRCLAAVTVVVTLSTTAFARPVFHIGLASSQPAKDSHVTTPLKEIRLTFTGRVDVANAGLDLLMPDSKAIALDSLRAVVDSPKVAVARVAGDIKAGSYSVKWHAVAADGATGSGAFNFMYIPGHGQ